MANYAVIIPMAEAQIRDFLAVLMPHFDDPATNEIMINAPHKVFVEQRGRTTELNVDLHEKSIIGAINAIASWNRKEADLLMDARLKSMRVAAVMPPVAVHGPLISIRKLSVKPQTFADYQSRGDFDPANMRVTETSSLQHEREAMERAAAHGGEGLESFFRWAMHARLNMVIAGGTSSGKTTLAGAFLDCIPDAHRVISCEDTNELVLRQPNVVQLEASLNHEVDLRRLIKMCLRLRPDRIIVGEVRGPEIFDLMDAANTGHPGTLFTIHADSAGKALQRMETLLRMSPEMREIRTAELRELIANSVDYVVFQSRSGLRRAPTEVIAIEKNLDSAGNYVIRTIYSTQPQEIS